MDGVIEKRKELRPPNLARIQLASSSKVFQIFVVRDDSNGGRAANQIVAPGFQTSNDSKEFEIRNTVGSFAFR